MTPLHISELLGKILTYINDGKSYKTVRLVCHMWYDMAGNHIDKYSNHLMTILDKNPNIITTMDLQDWSHLCRNPNLTLEFIEKNIHNPKINWNALTVHPIITLKFILQHQELQWEWDMIYYNPNITWEIMMKNPHLFWDHRDLYNSGKMPREVIENNLKIPWLFQLIRESEDNHVPEDLILKNIDLAWRWNLIIYNKELSWDFISKYHNKFHMYHTCSHPNVSIDNIRNNPDWEWDYQHLSYNPNITEEFIMTNLDKKWDFSRLIYNKKISMSTLLNNPDIIQKSGIYYILNRDDLTMELLRKFHSLYQLDWFTLITNKVFTWDTIMSTNGAPTGLDMDNNLPWSLENFTGNPNITWQVFSQNPQINWNIPLLFSNKFHYT